jgi:hypothetical protein
LSWTSYTPTFTNIAKGNATTWVTEYCSLGAVGFVRANLVFGSTSSVSGDIQIDLPSGWTAANIVAGTVVAQAGGTIYYMTVRTSVAGTVLNVRANNASGTYLTNTNASSTIPGTWTTNDYIRFIIAIPL